MSLERILADLLRHDDAVRRAAEDFVRSRDRGSAVALAKGAALEALGSGGRDLGRLPVLARLLGRIGTDEAVDGLLELLDAEAPEAREVAGEALVEMADERFARVRGGMERFLAAREIGPALEELPFVVADIDDPGGVDLLLAMLEHRSTTLVAGAIEVSGELAHDARITARLEGLVGDERLTTVEGEGGEDDATISLGELASDVLEAIRSTWGQGGA